MIKKRSRRLKRNLGQRQTLAKQVRELALTDTFGAALLAERGRKFSGIEVLFNLYYPALEQFRQINSGQKTTEEKVLEGTHGWTPQFAAEHRVSIQEQLEEYVKQLCEVFIEAVNARDSKKIHKIADAVEFLKTFKPGVDHWRYKILMERSLLEARGIHRKIAHLAKIIGWPENDKQNGFPQLRRLCKELNYPLESSRQTTRK